MTKQKSELLNTKVAELKDKLGTLLNGRPSKNVIKYSRVDIGYDKINNMSCEYTFFTIPHETINFVKANPDAYLVLIYGNLDKVFVFSSKDVNMYFVKEVFKVYSKGRIFFDIVTHEGQTPKHYHLSFKSNYLPTIEVSKHIVDFNHN